MPRKRALARGGSPLAGLGLFWVIWSLLLDLTRQAFFGTLVITDTPVYVRFAQQMTSGLLPYRDCPLEYPPASIPRRPTS